MAAQIRSPFWVLSGHTFPGLARFVASVRYALPEGRALPAAAWQQRHRAILVLLWLHTIGIALYGVATGYGWAHSLSEGGIVALAALLASWPARSRRFRAAVASLGLVTSSALLVHLSGGFIEMHFHFFVMVIIISLYQDWVPFLLAIGFVVFHHGVLGVLDPTAVYNHPDAWAQPWKWAVIHGAFVLAASAASIVNWRLSEDSRERAEQILDSTGEGIYGLDAAGNIRFINPAAARLMGWTDSELVGLPAHDLLHAPQPDRTNGSAAVCPACAVLADGRVHESSDGLFRKKDGSTYPVEYISTPIRERRRLAGAVVAFKDIAQRQWAEAALLDAHTHLVGSHTQLERRSEEIRILNTLGGLLQSCLTAEEAHRIIGHTAQRLFPGTCGALYIFSASRTVLEAVGQWGDSEPLKRLFAPNECWALRRGQVYCPEDVQAGLFCQHVAPDGGPSGSYCCIPMMAQGEALGVLHLQLPLLPANDSHSSTTGPHQAVQQLAVTVAEQSALALANLNLRETLRQQSIRDSLTGLYNRRYLEETLDRELARAERKGTSLSIIMLDVDHFKQFNDTFGHAAGDAVLRDLGGQLWEHVRGEDIACRYGGEEFALVLTEAGRESAMQRAELLREAIAHMQVNYRGQTLGAIRLSLGLAVFPEHGTTQDALLQSADVALYRAKRSGRNQLCVSGMPLTDLSTAVQSVLPLTGAH